VELSAGLPTTAPKGAEPKIELKYVPLPGSLYAQPINWLLPATVVSQEPPLTVALQELLPQVHCHWLPDLVTAGVLPSLHKLLDGAEEKLPLFELPQVGPLPVTE
jgi:hypothetical protein